MNKTQYSDGDTSDRDIVKAEIQRADINARALTAMKNRIREFYSQIKFVAFGLKTDAPTWADSWFDYLLTGKMPVVEEVADENIAIGPPDLIVVDDAAPADETRPGGDGLPLAE